MTISRAAPVWRRQAERLRTVALHCNDPKLREELANIATAWMRRTLVPATPTKAR